MTTPYDKSYHPPFPVLPVVLGEESSRIGPFSALIDSGSDASLAPTGLLEEIGAGEGEEVAIRSHFGERQSAQIYLIALSVGGILLPGVYVVGDDTGREIILGRNILNKLPLFLDGPSQQTDLLDDETVKRLRAR